MPVVHTYIYKFVFCTFPNCAKTKVLQSHISTTKSCGACAWIPDIRTRACCSHFAVWHSDFGRNTKSPCGAMPPLHTGTFISCLSPEDTAAGTVQCQEGSAAAGAFGKLLETLLCCAQKQINFSLKQSFYQKVQVCIKKLA